MPVSIERRYIKPGWLPCQRGRWENSPFNNMHFFLKKKLKMANLNLDVKTGLLAHATVHILLLTALMIPPSTIPHAKLAIYFLAPILVCDFYTWRVGLGFLAVVEGLWACELLLFRNPREDFKLLHFQPIKHKIRQRGAVTHGDESVNERTKKIPKDGGILPWREPFPDSPWQRFLWVFKLTHSIRYTGWDIGNKKPIRSIKSLSSSSSSSSSKARFAWLLKEIGFIVLCILIHDAMHEYMAWDTYFHRHPQISIDEPLSGHLSSLLGRLHLGFLPPRAVRIAAMGAQQYAIFSMVGSIPAVFLVALGWVGLVGDFYGRMENYPRVMGSPLAVIEGGLRGFWGKFWHQIFRQVCLLPRKSLSSSCADP
jgi:uncharacterized protein YjeT (DUF2065 family)